MIQAIIVTFEAPERLAKCVKSLEGQAEVNIEYNTKENNRLYTKALNDGMRKQLIQLAGPDYILLVCDDVEVQPGCVSALSKFLDENPRCGIAMPVQVGRSGDVSCGGCTKAFPVGFHITEPLTHKIYEKPFESFWANGACFLIRTAVIQEIGLMDENMKFICSDSDWSFSARARGWSIFVVPDARVTHEPDGALHYKNEFIEKTKDQDSLYFMRKWITGGLFQEMSAEGASLTMQDVQNRLLILTGRLQHGYSPE